VEDSVGMYDRSRSRLEAKLALQILGHDKEPVIRHVNINKESVFIHIHDWAPAIDTNVQLNLGIDLRSPSIHFQAKVLRVVDPNQWGKLQGVVLTFTKVEDQGIKPFDQLLSQIFQGKGLGCRNFPRADLVASAEIIVNDKVKKSKLKNISKGGAFVLVDTQDFELDMDASLKLIHPSSKRSFLLKGFITRIQGPSAQQESNIHEGVGLKFTQMSPVREKDLDLFLRNLIFSKQRKKKSKS